MTTLSIHEIADELRASSDLYAPVSDDYGCIALFFKNNSGTITEKGITITDKTPKLGQLASTIHASAKVASDLLEASFDNQARAFKALLLGLKDKDESIEALFNVEVSSNVEVMKTVTHDFKSIHGQLCGADMFGIATKEKNEKAIQMMLDFLNDKPFDPAQLTPELAKFFAIYETIAPQHKALMKASFEGMLQTFAKCCVVRMCPVSIHGKLLTTSKFIMNLKIRPVLDHFGIKPETLVVGTF